MSRICCIVATVVLSFCPGFVFAQKKGASPPHPARAPSYHPPRASMPHPARPPAPSRPPHVPPKTAAKKPASHAGPKTTAKPPSAHPGSKPANHPPAGTVAKSPTKANHLSKPATLSARPATKPNSKAPSVALKPSKIPGAKPAASATKPKEPAALASRNGVPSALTGSVPSALSGVFPAALPGSVPSALATPNAKIVAAAAQVGSIPISTPNQRTAKTSTPRLLVPRYVVPNVGVYGYGGVRRYGRSYSHRYGYPYRHRYAGPYRYRTRTYRPAINRAALWELQRYQQLVQDLSAIRPGTFAGGLESQALATDLAACVKPPLRIDHREIQTLANRVVSALASRSVRRNIDAPDLARSLFIVVNGGRLPLSEGGGMSPEPEVIADIEQILRFSGATQQTARAVSQDLKALVRL